MDNNDKLNFFDKEEDKEEVKKEKCDYICLTEMLILIVITLVFALAVWKPYMIETLNSLKQ